MHPFANCTVVLVACALSLQPALALEPRLGESVERAVPDGALAAISDLPTIEYDTSTLPAPVARLRQQLIDTARAGDIDGLKAIIEGNELVPKFSFDDESDPIAYWKEASGDGEGREILAIMLEVLQAGFVKVAHDPQDPIYVWPYFAEIPLAGLTPMQEVELYMLVTAQDRRDMEEFGAYNFFRLGIAEDGQWQYFIAGD